MHKAATLSSFLLLLFCCLVSAQEPETVRPARNSDAPDVREHPRPYEMDWAGRTEPPRPEVVDFEDLTGWEVHCFRGADAQMMRSRERKMYGRFTGKAVYSGTSSASRYRLVPPDPIEIPGKFNAVNLWVRGNNWGWINPPATARVNVSVVVRDAKDHEYRIDLGVVNFNYWFLMHRTTVSPDGSAVHYVPLSGGADARIDWPARFVALEVRGCSNEQPAKLFFDSLTFYEKKYEPVDLEPVPEDLPWPTTEDTILPQLKSEVSTRVQKNSNGCRFVCEGDERIVYEVTPRTGGLGDVKVRVADTQFRPCAGGGIRFELGGQTVEPGDAGADVSLVDSTLDDGVLRTKWRLRSGGGQVTYSLDYSAKGKSLIVDARCSGGHADRFQIGRTDGLKGAKLVQIPYLTVSASGPRVACKDGVFLFPLMDWYNSDASRLYSDDRVLKGGEVSCNGGAEYLKKTDGSRNDLRERLFISVSTDFQEVLPTIPNPKCDTGDIARHCVWRNIGSPKRDMLRKFKRYGIDRFIACHHEVGWRDAGESFTMRLKAAPRIGDEGLKEYSQFVRELGYRFGTYTNYVDFAPVNRNWDEDLVALDSEGRWQRAWPRCYALKPLAAAMKEAYYAPRIHKKFGTNAQYCDVHTAYRPWDRTDYDARTPGAGMFRTQFNSFARLLWNESDAHDGPVFSEGSNQWFYAGIVDGNYGQLQRGNERWKMYPLVDFDLLQMHPKMTDFGMGMPRMFYDGGVSWRQETSRTNPHLSRFLTSTIAFGHIGFLARDWGFEGTLKSYYMLQALQQRYAMVPVEDIGYFNGEHIVDTSQAVESDAYKRRQVYVKYESGLQVWANLSFEDSWSVSVDGAAYELPPGGFVARKPGDILACSAVVNGARRDVVRCADYLYLDSRGPVARTDAVTTRGVVAVKPAGEGKWSIIPATSCEEVTLAVDALPGRHDAVPRAFEAKALDESGAEVGEPEVRPGPGEVTVMPVNGAMKYELRTVEPEEQPLEVSLLAAKRSGVRGLSIPAGIRVRNTSDSPVDGLTVAWSEFDKGGSEVNSGDMRLGGSLGAGNEAELEFDLPLSENATVGARRWYRIEVTGEVEEGSIRIERWLDVTALRPVEVEMDVPGDAIAEPEGTQRLEVELKSNLPGRQSATVQLKAGGDTVSPGRRRLSLDAGQPAVVEWQVEVGRLPGTRELRLDLHLSGGVDAQRTFYLSAQPTKPVVQKLVDAEGFETGMRIRGQEEQALDHPNTGAIFARQRMECGGTTKDGFFCHPPYKTGVGYTCAAFPVKLPEQPCRFEFDIGFREGSSTTDGCVFTVVVLDEGRQQTVFEEQYQQLGEWRHCEADLSDFTGQKVRLKLITDVGPADDSNSDWACWGEPRIVMNRSMFRLEVATEKPRVTFGPPPQACELTLQDLKNVREASIVFDSAGLQSGGRYVSYASLNGEPLGKLPGSTRGDQWSKGHELALSPEAVRSLGMDNVLTIRNPGGDSYKVGDFYLRLALEDGRTCTSCVDRGPYTSDDRWKHAEGERVPTGEELPPIHLFIPLSQK